MEIRDNIIIPRESDAGISLISPLGNEKIIGYAIVPKERLEKVLTIAGITMDEFMDSKFDA